MADKATKPDKIYTITVFRDFHHKRCIGFYHEKNNSVKSIEANYLDIADDGYYKYAVVEEVSPGLYNLLELDHKEIWFEWDKEKKKYQQCKKPENLFNTINFGMG